MVELCEYSNDALFKKRVKKYKINTLGKGIYASIFTFIFIFLFVVFLPKLGILLKILMPLVSSLLVFVVSLIQIAGIYRVCMIYVVDKEVDSGDYDTYKLKLDDQKWYNVDRDSYDNFNRNQSYKVLVKNKYILNIYDNMPY